MKKLTRTNIKRRLRGRRTYKQALKSSSYSPVFYPHRTMFGVSTIKCNGGCRYCSNEIFPDYENQFKYKEVDPVEFANGLNRFYNQYQYYISGGECAMLPDFYQIIQNMQYSNIIIFTNLSEPSVEQLIKIGKTSNNISLYISYHFHMMEFKTFVRRYNELSMYDNKDVHIIRTDGVDVEDVISFLGRYGIPAIATNEFTDNGIFKRIPKKVRCAATNIQIMPDGSIHPCRSRAIRKCKPVANMFDDEIKYSFNEFIDCDFHGFCGPCDIDREVEFDSQKSE